MAINPLMEGVGTAVWPGGGEIGKRDPWPMWPELPMMPKPLDIAAQQQNTHIHNIKTPEYTGGSVSYYKVYIDHPVEKGRDSYSAECNDIIEALKMNYAEGNAFKAIWRSCAARNLGLGKAGYKDGKYDAEKVVFFGQRMVEQAS